MVVENIEGSIVMENNISINLNETEIKKALKIMMSEQGIDSMADIARALNIKETTFRSAISNNAIRLADFLKVAELLGYELIVTKKK
jgi:predicted HTH domain antitoxin